MALSWGPIESLATMGGTLLAILGVFGKQQRDKGILEEKVKELDKKVSDDMARRLQVHEVTLSEHTASIAAHEGSFKVIDSKLDNLKEGQGRTQAALEKLSDKLESCFELKR